VCKIIDLTGQIFGGLIVVRQYGKSKDGRILWLCLCDCGKNTVVQGGNLKNGNTKSCGCQEGNLKHRMSRTKIYQIWNSMIQRCTNPVDKKYKDYGGRGINVCNHWSNKENGFENFLKDVGVPGKGLTLDRIDNDGDYKSNNWRWATHKQQNRNMRRNINILFNNKIQCLKDWAIELNIKYTTLYCRIYKLGWSIERAFKISVKK